MPAQCGVESSPQPNHVTHFPALFRCWLGTPCRYLCEYSTEKYCDSPICFIFVYHLSTAHQKPPSSMPPVDTASSTVGITKPNDPFMAELYDRFNKTPFTNSPIGRVPPEVLRIIIVLAVSHPGDSRTVLRASHVSRKWRDVVLATSELFTHADWDHWHVELLRGWYERSKQRPLTITLGHRTSNIIFDIVSLFQPDPINAPHSFSLLLDVALMRCSSLSLTFFSLMHKSRDQQHEELGKFAARYPMIFDLRFTIMRGPVFPIRLDNWPTVRKLHIGLAPTLTTVSQVEHITIDFYAILRSTPFPLLPQLSYLFIYGIPAGGFGWFQNVVHLDALRHLEIRELEDDDAIEEEPFGHLMFHYLKAPNVECFTLNGMVLSSKAAAIFWPALVSRHPPNYR
ncbi:hypothetical protein DL93DRAFT_1981248 [Clavulina sp. PMI_390]|nr:hypothetical protein DL93DRAFT_1981248 [Clavulina sp. PMI_390]